MSDNYFEIANLQGQLQALLEVEIELKKKRLVVEAKLAKAKQ